MSYKTKHQLYCVQGGVSEEEIADFLERTQGRYPGGDCGWEDVINGCRTDWEGRDADLRAVSQNWPQAVFALDTQGEDETGTSREYHWNGEVRLVHSSIPEFSPAMFQKSGDEAPEDQWEPGESIYPGLRARNLLDEALWNLNEGVGNNYPDDEDSDRLAPSLKAAVMKIIRTSSTQPCRHGYEDLADMSHDVMAGLPAAERIALREAINTPVQA